MKYIDADKLKTELNKRIELLENGDAHSEVMKRVEGIIKGYKAAITIIDSLQQEQDCIIINKKDWEPQEQFRKNKAFGKPLKEEQPEVDLDKLINDFLLNNSEFLVERDSKVVVQKLARHFYELGLNARKEG